MKMSKREIDSGDKIRVTDVWNEVFHGQLHFWEKNTPNGVLILKNVFSPSTQNYSAGTLRFFSSDIKKVELLENENAEQELNELNSSSIARSRNASLCTSFNESFNNHGMPNSNRIRNSTLHSKIDSSMNYDESSFNNHDITITSTESLNKKNKIDLSKYNYNLNSDYGSSASIIKSLYNNVKIISLKIFTNDNTGNADISAICIHADDWTYIFDVNSIRQEDEDGESEAKFTNLLKDFLNKPKIVKIVYDGHFTADVLFNKYQITLNNVFDIKMANKEVDKETDQSNVNFEYLIGKFASDTEENQLPNLTTNWKKRPFNKEQKYLIIRQTACLFNLYTVLKEKLIDSFMRSCDQSIKFVKNKNVEHNSNDSVFIQTKGQNKRIHSSNKSMTSRNNSNSENIHIENFSNTVLDCSSSNQEEKSSSKLKSFFQKIEDNRKTRSISESSCDSFNTSNRNEKSGVCKRTLNIPPAGSALQNYTNF